MKQKVYLPTKYRITHVILMKQEVDLPTRYSNYTGNYDEITCVILYLVGESTSCFIRITCIILYLVGKSTSCF
jgi:hypothetical protein